MIATLNNPVVERWLATQGVGVRVVVLDSGFAKGTPGVYPVEIQNFTKPTGGTDPTHGTRVAQVIGSSLPSCPGVAPQCNLYLGTVVGQLEAGWRSLHDALDWAIKIRADVLNMSFACAMSDPVAEAKLLRLDAMGCICVASYNPHLHWPHSNPFVISVGVLGKHPSTDLQAVGASPVAIPNGTDMFTGTSSAAAVVAGVAACAKASRPVMYRTAFLNEIAGK
jgi:subtilisin family serine protease